MVYICSGGIKVIFLGRGLDVVPFVLIIDIVDDGVNSTVLMMPYSIVSMYLCL